MIDTVAALGLACIVASAASVASWVAGHAAGVEAEANRRERSGHERRSG